MMTLRQLIKNTPRYVKNSGRDVKLMKVKKRKHADGSVTVTGAMQSRPPTSHEDKEVYYSDISSIRGNKVGKGYVKVSCTCMFFLYYCEVALHNKGAADVIHSNGKQPSVTNPGKIPISCKHLSRLYAFSLLKNL